MEVVNFIKAWTATRGKELAYSNSMIERALDKLAGAFRFRGTKPEEIAIAKQLQKAENYERY
jgi:hypothetical protein